MQLITHRSELYVGQKKDCGVTESVSVNEPNYLPGHRPPRPCPGEVLRSRGGVGGHIPHGIHI